MTIQGSQDSKYNPCMCIQQSECHATQTDPYILKLKIKKPWQTDNYGNDLHKYIWCKQLVQEQHGGSKTVITEYK
jgi:hypothetical protein